MRNEVPIIKLSPTSLNLYLECPRCFWLRFNKNIYRPEGVVSTLPRGMDFVLKSHYDNWRRRGLPPELSGQVPGRLLQDQAKVEEMRDKSFGFKLAGDVWFGGGLDDALELPDGSIVPLDNKTRGFPPREAHWSHLAQMSGYTLILRERGTKTVNVAYIVHWFFDHRNVNPSNPLGFNVAVEEVKTEPDSIKKKILEAVETLRDDIPKAGQRSGQTGEEPCPFCAYRELGRSGSRE